MPFWDFANGVFDKLFKHAIERFSYQMDFLGILLSNGSFWNFGNGVFDKLIKHAIESKIVSFEDRDL